MPSSIANRFLLLYGSQTGQAKAISEEIAEKAEKINLKADVHCLSQTEKKFNIEREHCVVIVTSTTGDGDPPDTAQKFVRRLKKKTLPPNHLENLNYALLGLGDSNYTNFCNNGKTIDKRLEQLGARRFYDSGWADDAVGLEIAVEPWMEGLFPALQKFLNVSTGNSGDSEINGQPPKSKELSLNGSEGNSIDRSDTEQSDSLSKTDNPLNGSDRLSPAIYDNSNLNSSLVSAQDSENRLSSGVSNPSENGHEQNSSENAMNKQNSKESHSDTDPSVCQPSLRLSVPPLSESALSLPVMPAEYLKCSFCDEKSVILNEIPLQNGCPLPSAASPVTMATVTSAKVLTRDDALKKTLCLRLDTKGKIGDYLPGDSVSVVVENTNEEVDSLLNRLGVQHQADFECSISVVEGTKKKNAAVPAHIPPRCTLRHILSTCLDIREPPKKALLRVFVQHTTDAAEKRRLQELCSKQGASDYTSFIRQPSVSVLDVLNSFPSCLPPAESLLELPMMLLWMRLISNRCGSVIYKTRTEHLSRLQPRPYSVCSSPLVDKDVIEIVFNVVHIPVGEGRTYCRSGLCTGMLDRLTNGMQTSNHGDVTEQIKTMNINADLQVPIFNRTNQHFRMSDDLSVPIIMIGPGTGVAPFVGFLRHREALKRDMCRPELYGDTWLFYGCRHKDRDYIYRNELEEFASNGVLTKLCVCFSRDDQDSSAPRYVQDNIRKYSIELSSLIVEKNATIYVCGDAKNMAKDVNEAIMSVIQNHKGCTLDEARAEVMKMRLHKRYLEDVWT